MKFLNYYSSAIGSRVGLTRAGAVGMGACSLIASGIKAHTGLISGVGGVWRMIGVVGVVTQGDTSVVMVQDVVFGCR